MIYEGKNTIFSLKDSKRYDEIIDHRDRHSQTGIRAFEIKLKKYVSTTGLGDIIDLTNLFLSLIYVTIGIVLSYQRLEYLLTIGIVECSLFILIFAQNFLIADNKVYYLLSFNAFVQYLTIIPFMLAATGFVEFGLWNFPMTTARIFVTFNLIKPLSRVTHDVTRQIYKLIVIIMSLVLIGASLMNVAEQDQSYKFLDWLYFMVVLLSSVGYGDIYPATMWGQLVVIISIISFLTLIPISTNKIVRFNNLSSQFAKQVYTRRNQNQGYILMLGHSNTQAYRSFLQELYHQDHGFIDVQTLILQKNKPLVEISMLLKAKTFRNVTYLGGDALDFNDLKNISAQMAECVVIMANKFVADQVRQDYINIMYALSVKNYVKRTINTSIRVCLQLLLPQHKELFYRSLRPQLSKDDQVICVQQLKLKLLGKTCVCAGINTLVSILVTSNNAKVSNKHQDWQNEYFDGMNNQIYRVCLPVSYKGKSFSSVAKIIYRQYRSLLIAVQADLHSERKVFLNPCEYIISQNVNYGYVIAKDSEQIKDFLADKHVSLPSHSYHQDNQSNINNGYYLNSEEKPASFNVDPKIFAKFGGHTILSGEDISGLKHFLMPLRAKSMNFEQIMPIVILHDKLPMEIRTQIQKFPKVYYYRGSPLRLEDLRIVSVERAQAFVILSQINRKREDQSQSSNLDADTIFIYRTVKLLNPDIKIFTELSSSGAISLLSSQKRDKEEDKNTHLSNQIFASGQIFVSTMLDTLICQAYYHTFITQIIQQMLVGEASTPPHLLKLGLQKKLVQSNLFLIGIPYLSEVQYSKMTFNKLFIRLLNDFKYLTIAIYRYRKQNNKYYLYLNPSPLTEMNQNDKLYVLSHRQPRQYNSKSTTDKELMKMDADNKKELERLQREVKQAYDKTKQVLNKKFQKEIVNKEFLPRVRSLLSDVCKDKFF